MRKHPNKGRLLAVIGISAMLFCSASCGIAMGNSGSVTLATKEPGSVDNYGFVDAADRFITLSGNITSVVTTDFSTTSLFVASGKKELLSGIDAEFANSILGQKTGVSRTDLPMVADKSGLDVDAITRINPQLVFLEKQYQDALPDLENAGIHVIITDSHTLNGFFRSMSCPLFFDSSRPITRDTMEIIWNIQNKFGKANKLSVYLPNADNYMTPAAENHLSELVEIVGGRNIAQEHEPGRTLTPEQLIEWNPDYILLPENATYTEEDILTDERLSNLYAVQNQRILTLPSVLYSYDSYSILVGVQAKWIAWQLHPELFETETVYAEIFDFYKKRYDLSLTLAELEG